MRKMVSNIYLSDAVKTGKFLMRRADQVTRKQPLGKCLIYALVSLAAVGAISCLYGVGTLLHLQSDTLFSQTTNLRAVRPSSGDKDRSEVPRDEPLANEPLARAGQEALRNNGGKDNSAPPQVDERLSRKRLVVLYTENNRINTGVWPGWGTEENADAHLNWAAAGVTVRKACRLPCTFTHDNSMLDKADAVVVESVNHPKFGLGGQAFEWPVTLRPNPRAQNIGGDLPKDSEGRDLRVPGTLPSVGIFYYEPDALYPGYNVQASEVTSHSDWTAVAGRGATLPITMVCPWGRDVEDFLRPPPRKAAGKLLAYFSEHGVSQPYRTIIDELFHAAGADGEGVHAFSHRRNREVPPEAGGDLPTRMQFVGTYRFILITDGDAQADFLSPEWSQAFLSGTVPIYGGAPNAAAFAPGPRSFLSLDDFRSGEELWAYLKSFDSEGDSDGGVSVAPSHAYARFFDWKKAAGSVFDTDDRGKDFALGTGAGVSPTLDADGAEASVRRWTRPPVPGSSESDLAKANQEGESEEFRQDAKNTWRVFRRSLDQCVHYAECRICELVHKTT